MASLRYYFVILKWTEEDLIGLDRMTRHIMWNFKWMKGTGTDALSWLRINCYCPVVAEIVFISVAST